MASLKEIKTRINSVNSTMKITSAMKMISSAKLHKSQSAIIHFLPYQQKLDEILTNLLSADKSYDSPFIRKRDVKKVAFIVFASNSSLCGAFNANIIKEFTKAFNDKSKEIGKENILVYPIGKKAAEATKKMNVEAQGDYRKMADKPSYEEVQELAKEVIAKYINGEIDEVVMIYHHFLSAGSQKLMNTQYLPFKLEEPKESKNAEPKQNTDYLLEPSKEEILQSLIPTVLYSRIFAALLDSNASEHAARMIAMQTATDNAKDLNQKLTIQYNKTRQQAVTNELLDIIGGAAALQ